MWQSLIQAIQQGIQSLIAELPKHVEHKVFELGVDYVRRARSKHVHENLNFTIEAFGQSIIEQRYAEALNLCTPALQWVLHQGQGLATQFEKLRMRLLEPTESHLSALEFDPSETHCKIKGSAEYGGNPSAAFSIDAARLG